MIKILFSEISDFFSENAQTIIHNTAVRNLTKVWKTETGPLQGGRAWSRGPESELFEILPYRDY